VFVPRSRELDGSEALFRPEDFIEGLRAGGWSPGDVPDAVVFTYGGFDGFCANQPDQYTMNPMLGPGPGRFFGVDATGGTVGICCMGIGAPAVVSVMELLAVLGVSRFLSLGTAGGLQAAHRPGDTVLVSEAVRDEGTSYHYLAADVPARPDADLTARLGRALDDAGVPYTTGSTWTIDAPYRETADEVSRYRAAGVLAVEMEASALFALGSVRQVSVASLLVVDGAFGDPIDRPQFDRGAAYGRLFGLLPIAVETLR
jgi:nucleoside phosphorylase